MHRFYAPQTSFEGDRVTLGETESHHLRDVLRHSVGDEIRVFDGEGGEYQCRVEAVAKRSANLSIIARVEPSAPESSLDLTIAAALLKGEKFDLVIKKCVELGVTRLVPLITQRCDVRPKDGAKKGERWQKMVIDASRQCGRATLMAMDEPVDFGEFVKKGPTDGSRIMFLEREGREFDTQTLPKKITAFVGPEGGWDDREISVAAENGIDVVTFGGRILRAETAAISIAAILQHRFGDLN